MSDTENKTVQNPIGGDEDDEVLLTLRTKVYRLADKEWKERGVGEVQILKSKSTDKKRVLMRREKTLKLCLNHLIYPSLELIEHKNSDKTWMWKCPADYSEEKPTEEFFAMKFLTSADATKWKETWTTGKKFADETKTEKSETSEKKEEEEVSEEKKEETTTEKSDEKKDDEKKE